MGHRNLAPLIRKDNFSGFSTMPSIHQCKVTPLETYRESCAWVWTVYRHYKLLSEDDAAVSLMNNFAFRFLGVYSIVLKEYALLQMCALTDPAGKDPRSNLTVDYLLRKYPWPKDLHSNLALKVERIHEIVEPIRAARNKIIAHKDLETAIDNKTLGEFPDNEDEEFFCLIEEVLSLMHEYLCGGPALFKVDVDEDVNEFVGKVRNATAAAKED